MDRQLGNTLRSKHFAASLESKSKVPPVQPVPPGVKVLGANEKAIVSCPLLLAESFPIADVGQG
jgi:hypothetical protein